NNAPDYVFIDATPDKDYTPSGYTLNTGTAVNRYENINVKNVANGPNHIEAILDGAGGYWLPPANDNTTSMVRTSEAGYQEYEVDVTARLTDVDGSEELLPE